MTIFTDRRDFLRFTPALALAATAQAAEQPATQAKRRILALGGGGFKTSDRELLLLKYILALTGKKNPQICYLPTAGADQPEPIVAWYETLNDLDCRPRHLRLINNSSNLQNLEQQLLAMDAIYVGGGNTLHMLTIWKLLGVDAIMRKAYERGIVLAGVSAGMICWFEQGVSDSRPGALTRVDGLGFLKGSACPHYDHKDRMGKRDRQESYHKLLTTGDMQDGVACDDGVALLYEDEKLIRAVAENPKAGAFTVRRAGDKAVEESLTVEFLGKKK